MKITDPNATPAQLKEVVDGYRGRVLTILKKLRHDSDNKLNDVLKVLRGCRILNYFWVASVSIVAFEQELIQLKHLPNLNYDEETNPIPRDEIDRYHYDAVHQKEKDDDAENPSSEQLITFWLKHQLSLPKLFSAYLEAAVITPSSGTSERVFSILDACFSDQQDSALEDIKEATVIMRYNRSFRSKDK